MSKINLSIITVGLSEAEIFSTLLPLRILIENEAVESIVVTPRVSGNLRSGFPFSSFYTDEGKGIYQAMNHALTKVKGSYVWFLNAGDQSTLNSHSSLSVLSTISSIVDNAVSPKDLPVLIFGSKLFANPYLAPLSRFFLALSLISLGMPASHQNILIPRFSHPEFTYSYRYSSDYHLLNEIVFCHISRILYVSSRKIARLAPGGISDMNRLDVFRERLQISFYAHHVSVILIIFPCFVVRLSRELLAGLVKTILKCFRYIKSTP
jgi:hypothetical protein